MRHLVFVLTMLISSSAFAAEVLLEAEGFADHGGWKLDSQFLDVMGSPYLLAHGLGKPIANAVTAIDFPETGTYRLWVRTKDWVPSHHPGCFKLIVDGSELPATVGNQGHGWIWQDGGTVEIRRKRVKVELADLTGFDGRCDTLFFTTDVKFVPPSDPDEQMATWRRQLLGLPEFPSSAGEFDVVVVGGGIAGCSAALTAARLGLQVAFIQNRPVLGGNASTEIGITVRGQNRSAVNEVSGPDREKAIQSQKNVQLFLGWHVFRATLGGKRIESVDAKNTSTNTERRFAAPVFIDCTGTGSVGFLAGADYRMGREAKSEFDESLAPDNADMLHHGNTVVFATRMADSPVSFPDVPWATAVSKDYADLGGRCLGSGWQPRNSRRTRRGDDRHARLASVATDPVPVAVHPLHEGFGPGIQAAIRRKCAEHEGRGFLKEVGQRSAIVLHNALVRLHTPEARPARSHLQVTQLDELSAEPGKFQNPTNSPIRVAIGHRTTTDPHNLNSH